MNTILYPVFTGCLFCLVILSGCVQPVSDCGNSLPSSAIVCYDGSCYPLKSETSSLSEKSTPPVKTPETSACTCGTTVPVYSVQPSKGLLVHYDFEDNFAQSGKVLDKSGNGRTAEVKGTVSPAIGISGTKGIWFSGSGYLQSPDNPAANRRDVTFSFWFKTDNPDANYKMASAASWNGGPGSGWTMATHVPEFWSDDGKGVLVPAPPNVSNEFLTGQWNHEVVTYDGNYIREFTNGKLINKWQSRGVPMGAGRPMAIGAWPGYGFYFIGDLDDFRIYDHTLTVEEISAMYQAANQ